MMMRTPSAPSHPPRRSGRLGRLLAAAAFAGLLLDLPQALAADERLIQSLADNAFLAEAGGSATTTPDPAAAGTHWLAEPAGVDERTGLEAVWLQSNTSGGYLANIEGRAEVPASAPEGLAPLWLIQPSDTGVRLLSALDPAVALVITGGAVALVPVDGGTTVWAFAEPPAAPPEAETAEAPLLPDPGQPPTEEALLPDPNQVPVEQPLLPDPAQPPADVAATPPVEEPLLPDPAQPPLEEPLLPDPGQPPADVAAAPPVEEFLLPDPNQPPIEEPLLPDPGQAPADAAAGPVEAPVLLEAPSPGLVEEELLPAPGEAPVEAETADLLPEPTPSADALPLPEPVPAETAETGLAPADAFAGVPVAALEAIDGSGLPSVPETGNDPLLPAAEPLLPDPVPLAAEAELAALPPPLGEDALTPLIPPGQVLVAIENLSGAPVDVYLDPEDGGEPQFVLQIEPGYVALQPSPPGRIWRFAQGADWRDGFQPTEAPRQLVTFNGSVK